MNSWKKTYVITAICLITAGIIYLMLPLSRKEISVKKTDLINSEVRGETKLYRINDNSIETSQGTYLIDENTVWVANDQEIDFWEKMLFLNKTKRERYVKLNRHQT